MSDYKVPEKKIFVYPSGGVDIDLFTNMDKKKAQDHLGLDKKNKYIGYISRIDKDKGYDTFVEAINMLVKDKKYKKYKYIIVGDGRYQARFEEQIDELGVRDKFVMIPRVPAERVPEILSNVDAGFISFNKTPLWENTIPAKLQSYMACGKAIIASASGETERVIKEAECGVCCEIGNAEALADGIRAMMKSDSNAMGSRAREYFEEKFDKKRLMDEMDRFLVKE